MRYPKIDPVLFIENRKKLFKQLAPNALAVLNSNDIYPTNADGTLPFYQNSDLFYLTGIDQEETILLIYPDAPEACHQEALFIKKTSPDLARWEGEKLSFEQAKEISGIPNVYWIEEFPGIFRRLMAQAERVYLNLNEHIRATDIVQTRDRRFVQWCQQTYPLHCYARLAPIMQRLRIIKHEIEIDLLRQACVLTEKAFRHILPIIRPGVMEYEIEAELTYIFLRNRSRGPAYSPIIAAGANSCVLHYTTNNQPCQAGDVVLLDIGAEYAYYRADLTRVVPVSGRFSSRQKAVYNAVLQVMRQAKNLLVPGTTLPDYHHGVGKYMEEQLVGLGLLTREDIVQQDPKKPAYKKYFMHGTSHHLGLDTHDVGDVYQKLEPGMVFTIEPGIYIPDEGIGIRLENNVVIRSYELEDLTNTVPLEVEEIEALMLT